MTESSSLQTCAITPHRPIVSQSQAHNFPQYPWVDLGNLPIHVEGGHGSGRLRGQVLTKQVIAVHREHQIPLQTRHPPVSPEKLPRSYPGYGTIAGGG